MTEPIVPDHIRAAIHAGHVALVVVYCDRCGLQFSGDFTGSTKQVRLDAARGYLAEKLGWSITPGVDLCPVCSGPDQPQDPDTGHVFPVDQVSTVENPLPCPERSPAGVACTKTIPPGWTAAEGHAGGHFWVAEPLLLIMRGGHYDTAAAVSGQQFDGHLPADCPGASCPYRGRVSR